MSWHYSLARSAISVAVGAINGWEVRGREHVPRNGGLIVASNHISFYDPPLVGAGLPREAYYLAKEELFSNPVFGTVIGAFNALPIRRGGMDTAGLNRAIERLRQGGALVMFPEGSRMRDGQLHPARPGVSMMAVAADVPILPAYISGSSSLARWATRRVRIRILFGTPRRWQDLAVPGTDPSLGREFHRKVGEALMREIAALRDVQAESAARGAV